MKRLAIGLFLLAGSLVTINSYSQVIVHAGIGIGIPIPQPPVVVYERPYSPPPVYREYRRAPEVIVVNPGRGYYGRNDRWDDCNRYDHHNKHYKNNGNGKGRGHDNDRYDERYGSRDNDRYDNRDNRAKY